MLSARPRFHFTPPKNFSSAPTGLVFHDGLYHLFYQHNPFGNEWGHMSWGHAVSRDLLNWEHFPVALSEQDGQMVFPGSAVVDHDNTSGLSHDQRAPLVLMYTAHDGPNRRETQAIAYSSTGRDFTRLIDNPVLDEDLEHFRNPKVFWYAPARSWVMVVALARARTVRFYRSRDLKAWTATGAFGPAGAGDVPDWESPDLFPLRIEGTSETRWVLKVDVGDGGPNGGSGSQYFIGHFDGRRFHSDDPPDRVRWTDWGTDFFAAQSCSDIPATDGRRVWLAWMSNWRYANQTPTTPWRGMMTVPRELSLQETEDDIVLVQRPVRELLQRCGPAGANDGATLISAVFDRDAPRGGFAVRCAGGQCRVEMDAARGELVIDRSALPHADFHEHYRQRQTALLPPGDGPVPLQLLIDQHSLECFAAGGRVCLSALTYFDGMPQVEPLPGSVVRQVRRHTLTD